MDRAVIVELLNRAEAHASTAVQRRQVSAARARVGRWQNPTPAGMTALLADFPAVREPLRTAVTEVWNAPRAPAAGGAAEDSALRAAQLRLQAAVQNLTQVQLRPLLDDAEIAEARARVQRAQQDLLAAQRAATAPSYYDQGRAAAERLYTGTRDTVMAPVTAAQNAAAAARDETRAALQSLQDSLATREQDWSDWFKDLMKDSATTVILGGVVLVAIGMYLWGPRARRKKS